MKHPGLALVCTLFEKKIAVEHQLGPAKWEAFSKHQARFLMIQSSFPSTLQTFQMVLNIFDKNVFIVNVLFVLEGYIILLKRNAYSPDFGSYFVKI